MFTLSRNSLSLHFIAFVTRRTKKKWALIGMLDVCSLTIGKTMLYRGMEFLFLLLDRSMNVGQIMNGLGGMLAQAAGPFISGTWFPPEERTTATAISSLSCPFGIALSYVIGPAIVPELPLKVKDVIFKDSNNSSDTKQLDVENTRKEATSVIKLEILHLMYGEFSIAAILLFIAMVYFPDKPKLPPSISASLPKLKFGKGFQDLIKKRNFWLILIVASSVTGTYSGWCAVLTVNLKDHGLNITQVRHYIAVLYYLIW